LPEVFEDAHNLTYCDDEVKDPNYKPPKQRASSPYPFETTEIEERRYPSREHKKPARYTVSAISVNRITDETPKVTKSVRFGDTNNQSTRREYANKVSQPALLQILLCLSLLNHASAANSEIIPVGTDLAKLIGPINLCSTTRPHDATYIDMEPIDDCTVVEPRQAGVGKLHITPYFPKHFSDSFDINSDTVLHWSGTSQWMMKNHSFKYNTLRSAEAIPNFEHMHLIANLVDHPMERDFDMLTELIQNSSLNILKILSVSSSNGNIIFDPTTLSEAAIHSVEIMKDVTESVLSNIFPLHKIITILVLIITAVILVFILIFAIRCFLQRKRRRLGR
jgi:hypothetical protein